jgi:two-component system, LytTR family, sensor kinase
MHAPRAANKRRRTLFWLGYAAAWIAVGAWLGLNVVIGFRNSGRSIPSWEPVTWELSSAVVMAVLAVCVYYYERRWPLSGPRWPSRLPLHVPAALVFSALHTLGMVGIRRAVYTAFGSRYDFGDPWLGFAYELQKDLISYAVIVVVCILIRSVRARRERELAVIRLQRDLSEARLAQLTAQIEPHFVFNALNAISNRMHEDVEAADRMIAAFAELLRAALAESGSAHVRVGDDVVWLERYFELMRERFRGQVRTSVVLDPAAASARVPRLLLQPLVENAFAHGLKSGRGRVDVRIRAEGKRLLCAVEDDGAGLAQGFASGTGLGNVQSRLDLLYGSDYRFDIAPRAGGGTRVEIDLPLTLHG